MIEQWVDADNESYRWNTTGVSGQVALRLDVNTLETSQLIVDGETFTLAGDGIDTVVPEEEAVVNPTDNAPDSPSPLTGELEEVTFVEAGSYIRSESFDTVYYITNDFQRRPFYNAQTFFTWHDTFDNVVFTTDATLPLLPLGSPMLPKAETVLVKIQSDARVFALGASDEDEGDLLRWIPSEDVAIELYGDDWSDYVIDLPPTLFPRFGEGQDMDRNEIVDKGALKRV